MRRKLAVVLAAAIVFAQLPQVATAAYADEIGGGRAELTESDESDDPAEISADEADDAEQDSADVNKSESDTAVNKDEGSEAASNDAGSDETDDISDNSVSTSEDSLSNDSTSDDEIEAFEEDKQNSIDSNFKWENNSDDQTTCTITGYDGTANGTLTIPSKLNGLTVTRIGNNAFKGMNFSGTLTIPDTVKEIGDSAFQNCTGLTGLKLPSKLEVLGNDAFRGCIAIRSGITIPGTVSTIGNYAFSGCYSLTSLSLGSGIETIGYYAFQNCSGIKGKLVIPDSVNKMNDWYGWSRTFSGCTGITSVEIGNGLDAIGERAFYGCTGIQSVKIGTGVKTIYEDAFNSCSSLTSLDIPATVEEISYNAFKDCSSLKTLTLREGLKTLGYGAFMNCSSLQGTVRIPTTLESWGAHYGYDGSFESAGNGAKLVLPEGLTVMGQAAFRNANFTGTLTIPSTIDVVPYRAFAGSSFTGLDLKPGVMITIGESAFENCTKMKGSLTIPNTVTDINKSAFRGCSGMKGSLTIPDSVTVINAQAFNGCSGFTKLRISKNLTKMDYYYWDDSPFYGLYGVMQIINNSSKEFSASEFINDNSYFVKSGSSAAIGAKGTIKTGTYYRVPAGAIISSATNETNGITVRWNGVSGANSYILQRRVNGGSWSTIATQSGTSYTDKKATKNGKKYEYRVYAATKADGNTYKGPASVVKLIYRVSQPRIKSLKNSASKTLTVRWGKNGSASGYQIQYSTDKNFKKSKSASVKSKSTVSHKLKKLTKKKTYYVRVRTYKTVGGHKYYSAWSTVKSKKVSK